MSSTKLLTIDFETYYDKDYSLSKLTTEEYIRSDLFEVIGVAVKENGGDVKWFSGTHQDVKDWLGQFDWASSLVLWVGLIPCLWVKHFFPQHSQSRWRNLPSYTAWA